MPPSLPVDGSDETITGVRPKENAKLHPPEILQAALLGVPFTTIACGKTSIAGGGGGCEGGTGGDGGDGGGGDGGSRGGIAGGGGGGVGGGDGVSRLPQSKQSVPSAQPLYSEPLPPSSQTPSLIHPFSTHSLLHVNGGEGGGGGGEGSGGGGGGGDGGAGGAGGVEGVGGGARGAPTASHWKPSG